LEKFKQILEHIKEVGLRVDWDVLKRNHKTLSDESESLRSLIEQKTGISNPNSSQQCAEYFHIKLQVPIIKEGSSGKISMDAEVLSKLAEDYPVASDITSYRSKQKGVSLIESLLKQDGGNRGRIRPEYSIGSTGRVFFKNPNVTGFSEFVREAVIPDEGKVFVYLDFASAELGIAATLAGESKLMDEIIWGEDFHSANAELLGCSRREAKTFIFALLYGASKTTLMEKTGLGEFDVDSYLTAFHRKYPRLIEYFQSLSKEIKEQGYSESWRGRKMQLEGGNHGLLKCINHVIQGTCSDIMEEISVILSDAMKPVGGVVKMIVFDAILLEVNEGMSGNAANIIEDNASHLGDFRFRVVVDEGENWRVASGKGEKNGSNG